MPNRYRLGSREWHADFERRRRRFDRMWPVMMVLAVLGAVTFITLIALGYLPVWLLFV
jgi:hypothetical protein